MELKDQECQGREVGKRRSPIIHLGQALLSGFKTWVSSKDSEGPRAPVDQPIGARLPEARKLAERAYSVLAFCGATYFVPEARQVVSVLIPVAPRLL